MSNLDSAERLGAATTLVSLDRTLPYYESIGLPSLPSNAEALKQCVRKAIDLNRQAFVQDSSTMPPLEQFLRHSLANDFGGATETRFFDWCTHEFVHGAADFEYFGTWYQFFLRMRGKPLRWRALAMPTRLAKSIPDAFEGARDFSEIKAIEQRMEEKALSQWDSQMYAIHHLYSEGREPFGWVLETVRKRKFMIFLRKLVNQLDDAEQQAFVVSANRLRNDISTFNGTAAFASPFSTMG